ncbi:hypothetical protein ASE90_01820 [Sphingomonas sp. Leaf67]|uniref:hypothetical protein n=1 Tax=Sphingomonas sp. Leaf67 TaxID=1736230 RepID=UPI0006FE9DB6|nr:hypothetical protein [Sphingomonas sp. Leaf67]KQN91566.1 hypothetical protein ASE90_01820 [Sphingomonas sp. Leaf67]
MNTALLLCAASVALPFAAMKARRRWRDFHRVPNLHGASLKVDAASVLNGHPVRASRANPSVERNETGKDGNGGILVLTTPDGVEASWIAERIAAFPLTPGPVWIGVDLRSEDSCGGHDDGVGHTKGPSQ